MRIAANPDMQDLTAIAGFAPRAGAGSEDNGGGRVKAIDYGPFMRL